MKRMILVGTVCALLGGAAVAIAGGGNGTPRPPGAMPDRATHTVASPLGKKASSRRPAPFRSVLFKETTTLGIPAGGVRGATLTCPRRSVATSGYWRTDGGIASDFNAIKPNSGRKWQVHLFDTTGSPGAVRFGVVCLKY